VLLDDVDAFPDAIADEVGMFLRAPPLPCAPLVVTTASLSLPPVRRLLAPRSRCNGSAQMVRTSGATGP